MAYYDVSSRPTASAVLQSSALSPFSVKSSVSLRRELADERLKNDSLSRQLDSLSRQLEEARSAVDVLQRVQSSSCNGNSVLVAGQSAIGSRTQRLIGRTCGRSRSLITF